MPRIRIGEKTYSTASLDEVSLRDLVLFNTQAAAMGWGAKWSDIERAAGEIDVLTDAEAGKHPDALMVLAATVWVTRRVAGDDVTLSEAIDVPLSQVDIIPEPQDRQPGKPRAAKKAAKKKVSAPATAPDEVEPAAT